MLIIKSKLGQKYLKPLDKSCFMAGHYVVYDIETELIDIKNFNNQNSFESRANHAPKIRAMVIYSSLTNEYSSYTLEDIRNGITLLLNAKTIVSYNGEHFDEPVLAKAGLIDKPFSEYSIQTIDLLHELEKIHGFKASLDALVKLNLGEKKHTKGRKLTEIVGDELIEACKSDVRQTKRLYELYLKDISSIKYPNKRQRRYRYDYDDVSGPFDHLSRGCKECGSSYGDFVEEDIEEMTEGQMAEYMAGTWGEWYCFDCFHLTYKEMV